MRSRPVTLSPCYYIPAGRAFDLTLGIRAIVCRLARRVLFAAVSPPFLLPLSCAFCAGGAAGGATGAVANKRLCSSGVINIM